MPGELALDLAARLEAEGGPRAGGAWAWPATDYQADPEGFVERELGVVLEGEERLILEAIVEGIRARLRVIKIAARGGRKVGKDFVVACLALWYYASFPGARVRFTSVTDDQSRDVFWREVRARHAESGRCVRCKRLDPRGPKPCPHAHPIEEKPAALPATGLRADDGREIVGHTASSSEAAAGVSGAFQFQIVDEASDVPEFIHEAIDGNVGGCVFAIVLLLSNPTRGAGRFYDAFHSMRDAYVGIHMSSRRSPNVLAGRMVVPGMATREWIEGVEEQYGAPSDFVTIHVDGDFVTNPEGTVFPLELIDRAMLAWSGSEPDDADRVLTVSCDVAGASDRADDSGFAAARGSKVLEVFDRRGLDPDSGAHVIELLGLAAKHRRPGDRLRVVIDREGEQGAKVWNRLLEYLAQPANGEAFELVGVRASARAQRDPRTYERVRDELAGNLAVWLKQGGTVPNDRELKEDLKAFRWVPQPTGRSRLMSKDEMKKQLGRSPDRADAVALAVWPTGIVAAGASFRSETPAQSPRDYLDPYGGGTIDPYG